MRFTIAGMVFLSTMAAWGSTTRVVTTLADSGAGSLRDAMSQANGSSGDTINFAHGLAGTILLQSPLPAVNANMIINGPGATALNINGQGLYGCLVVLEELDLSGVTVENCNSATGAIYLESGTLKLTNVDLKYNMSSGSGGALFNNLGFLFLTNVSLSLNSASVQGGALYNLYVATLTNVTFNGNSSPQGGAIANRGSLEMVSSTLEGNYSRSGAGGGALYNAGDIQFDHSSFINNSSTQGTEGGGAILNEGAITASNSTFWLNNADNFGGAISNSGVLDATYLTVANNSAPGGSLFSSISTGDISIGRSILAHGSSGPNCDGPVTSQGYNLSDDSSCNLVGTGDIQNMGASLDPNGPQLNGGVTPTIALLPESLAIDRIPLGPGCMGGDQRRVGRPQGPGCDIGAFELAGLDHFTAKLGLITGLLGRFSLTADFTLQSDQDALDPTISVSTLRIGTYQASLPAGSFRSIGTNTWAFARLVNGTGLAIQIQSLGGEKYQLTAQGAPANFFAVVSPTILSLTIGVYSGAITVPFTPAI